MCVTRPTEIQGPSWLCMPTGAATSTGPKARPGVGAGEAELGPLLGHFYRCVCTERGTLSQALPGSQDPRHTRKHTYMYAYLGTKRPDTSKHRHRETPTAHGQTGIDRTRCIVDSHTETHTHTHSHTKAQTPGRHMQPCSGLHRHVLRHTHSASDMELQTPEAQTQNQADMGQKHTPGCA